MRADICKRGQRFYTHTLIGRYKTLIYNTCAQYLQTSHSSWKAYPMEKKSMAGAALRQLSRGLRCSWAIDIWWRGRTSQTQTEFMKYVRDYGIDYHLIEPHRPQQNRAETVIQAERAMCFDRRSDSSPTTKWRFGYFSISCKIMLSPPSMKVTVLTSESNWAGICTTASW